MPDQSPPDLASLRVEIDRIDDALHDLLMRRAGLVAGMAARRVKGDSPTFRPGREAMILRRLLARHEGALPRSAVVRFWREIIASSLAQQSQFSVAAAGPLQGATPGSPEPAAIRLARLHFGPQTPLKIYHSPSRVLAAVAAGEASVAVLPAPEEGEPLDAAWWIQMETPRLQVVAALPFLCPRDTGPQAYAVAPLLPDATGQDRSLLRFEPDADFSRARIAAALSAAGLPPRWLIRRDVPIPMALAEVEGFLLEDDPRLAALPFPRLQILGAYAAPEPEEEAR
jgi:chorismate mutase